MMTNEGLVDRSLRVVAGYCPLYSLLGISAKS
jgi:hypothetical protein